MEEEIQRLQIMMGKQDVWQKSQKSEDPFGPIVNYATNAAISQYEDEDKVEIFLSNKQDTREILDDTIGYNSVHDFPGHSLEVGQEAPDGELFCSLETLNQYPYEYMDKDSRENIVKEFFAKGKIYDRAWDFFYIYPPASLSKKALILVPSTQFQHFLTTINESQNTSLQLPSSATETSLVLDFPKDGTPRPRFLGHTKSYIMAENLKGAIPSVAYKPTNERDDRPEPTEWSLQNFKRKMEVELEHGRRKKVAIKERKKTKRFALQREWVHVTKRVQRYLGLREGTGISSVEKNQETQVSTKQIEVPKELDVTSVAPYTQEDSVIFICIDVETYERNHNTITEVGIATLDTADLAGLSPGVYGENWREAIRARHFRIKGTAHLKNTQFVRGCPEHFQFGKSEWVDLKDAPKHVASCFKHPYSAEADLLVFNDAKLQKDRNIILVGHDVDADINYLRKIGYDVSNLSNLHEIVDTTAMYRAFKREPSPRNLGSILVNLDIAGWYLHNAGNDAVYTLQAMLGIAIQSLLQKKDPKSREQEFEERITESVRLAFEAASENQQGWSTDGSDGGSAVPPFVAMAAAAAEEKKVSDDKKKKKAAPRGKIPAVGEDPWGSLPY